MFRIKQKKDRKTLTQAEQSLKTGTALQREGKLDEAIAYYKKAIQLNPAYAGTFHNLGNALQLKGEPDEAILCYQKAIKLNPHAAVTYNNLGNVLQEKGQIDQAILWYQKALDIDPHFVMAYVNFGVALDKKGQITEALLYYQKALQIDRQFSPAYFNLGNALSLTGRLDDAELCYRKALDINPEFLSSHSALLLLLNHNPRYTAQDIYDEHREFSRRHAGGLPQQFDFIKKKPASDRKIRIGYVSPDFRHHSVAYFIEPVIASHNREFFEIFCYSNVLIEDEVTIRMRKYSDQWRNIAGISDEVAAELIYKDEIDILVDLSGHTANNRILLFARKPAPVQVTWIGYPSTTGLTSIDYKMADTYTDPAGMTEHYHTEKLFRLPESFLCYLPDDESPEIKELPSLTSGCITFGSFNNFTKVTSEVTKLWMKILMAIPHSRLILKSRSFSDALISRSFLEEFIQGGIEMERIELLPMTSFREHLNTYNTIDIGLDTFPYNGTTTTCEAMWMGVPVITLAGKTHASRAGVSLLSNVGLKEFIAHTSEEYITIAVNLAKDIKRLKYLRAQLRDMMTKSPLCDAKRFTANLEICYRRMWETWCQSD
jgi:protein O-GlcNAc transferase